MRRARAIAVVFAAAGAVGLGVAGYVAFSGSPEPSEAACPNVPAQGAPVAQADGNESGLEEPVPLGSVFGINRPAPPPIVFRVGQAPGEGDGPDLGTPASAVHSALCLLDEGATGELASCFVDGTESPGNHLYPGSIGHPVGLVEVVEEGDSARVVWEATVVTAFSRRGREWPAGETIQLTARLVQVEGLWRLVTLHEGKEDGAEPDLVPTVQNEASRTLSFPRSLWMGTLSLELETGLEWAPDNVLVRDEWDRFGAAQGDVNVPADRNVMLSVRLALTEAEAARLLAEQPRAHQMLVADVTRRYPRDLSGLAGLDPNDLFWLKVSSALSGRAAVNPRILGPIRHLTGLEMLTLENSGVSDEGLADLRSLRSLKGLEVTGSALRNESLAVLKELPALEYLYLHTRLSDAGVKEIAQLSRLRWLRLGGATAWGASLAELGNLPRLERLCFMTCSVPMTDQHIRSLEGLAHLKGLTLWGEGQSLTDASLASIGKLENLEELYFIRTGPKFTSRGVAQLKQLKQLKVVDFGQAWSGPRGVEYGDRVARQLARMPRLESVRRIEYLSYNGMKALAKCQKLRCLHVSLRDRRQGYRGRTGLSHLVGLSHLEELAISSGDALSAADVATLAPLGQLKKLLVLGPNLSDESLAAIGKLRQLEELDLLCDVTLGGLNHLNGLSRLRQLNVSAGGHYDSTVKAGEVTLDLSGLQQVEKLTLSELGLRDNDLVFVQHLRSLAELMISPRGDSSVTGASLRYLGALPELGHLRVFGLWHCTGEDLAHLNGLPKLWNLRLTGDITGMSLASLTGPVSLERLSVETDRPIAQETVDYLKRTHPVIEYIHIHNATPSFTRPAEASRPTQALRPAPNGGVPARGRRRR